ncbi:hypothetical protein TNCV_5083641 [Trichonephila clavipes]|uniref:Uncharacterized protein n=1 Tax=Trichonephila clavipes TaxID=2585209 RepID=A0A8X6S3B7_TRICX|nr:hypothetical protein TNCV_5083641 [Trichonephila clavipes]
MLPDYNTSSAVSLLSDHLFFRHRFFLFSLVPTLSPLVARSFSLYRVSRSTCLPGAAVDPYTPHLSMLQANASSAQHSCSERKLSATMLPLSISAVTSSSLVPNVPTSFRNEVIFPLGNPQCAPVLSLAEYPAGGLGFIYIS